MSEIVLAKIFKRAGLSFKSSEEAALFLPVLTQSIRKVSRATAELSPQEINSVRNNFIKAAEDDKQNTIIMLEKKAQALFEKVREQGVYLPLEITLSNFHTFEVPTQMTQRSGKVYKLYQEIMVLHDTYAIVMGKTKSNIIKFLFQKVSSLFEALANVIGTNLMTVVLALVGGSAIYTAYAQGGSGLPVSTILYTLLALSSQHFLHVILKLTGSYFKGKSRFHTDVSRVASNNYLRSVKMLERTFI
jgi:hypothetical protein